MTVVGASQVPLTVRRPGGELEEEEENKVEEKKEEKQEEEEGKNCKVQKKEKKSNKISCKKCVDNWRDLGGVGGGEVYMDYKMLDNTALPNSVCWLPATNVGRRHCTGHPKHCFL